MTTVYFKIIIFAFAFWPLIYKLLGISVVYLLLPLSILFMKKLSLIRTFTFILMIVITATHALYVEATEWYYPSLYLFVIFLINEFFKSISSFQELFGSTARQVVIIHLLFTFLGFLSSGSAFYFFDEPSHVGVTIAPFFVLTIFNAKTRFRRLFWFLLMTLNVYLLPSVTFLVGYLCLFIFVLYYRISRLASSIILLSVVYVIALNMSFLLEQGIKTESLFIWQYGFVRAFAILTENPLGVGMFGWVRSDLVVNYSDLTTFNDRDMASILPFMLSSFGYLTVGLLLLILFKRTSLFEGHSLFVFTIFVISSIRWIGPTLGLLPIALALITLGWRVKNTNEITPESNKEGRYL